jgi:hypothetical protein
MRTKSPIVKEGFQSGTIWTDEEVDLPIEIEYEYAKINDLFGSFCVAVTIVDFRVLGKTTTPREIITEQIEQIIREAYPALSVDFNY